MRMLERIMWLLASRLMFSFNDEDGAGGGGGKDEPPKNDPPNKPELTDEQKAAVTAEIERVAGKIRTDATKQAKRDAEKELAESLGLSVEDAKAIIAKHQAEEDAKKSEADKAREAADREKADAEKEKSEAARDRHAIKVERALFLAGVKIDPDADAETKSKRLAKAAALVDVEVGADEADITTAVETLKEDMPELFGEVEPGKPRPPNSDPKVRPPKPKGGDDAMERGKKRAQERKSKIGDFTFAGNKS